MIPAVAPLVRVRSPPTSEVPIISAVVPLSTVAVSVEFPEFAMVDEVFNVTVPVVDMVASVMLPLS